MDCALYRMIVKAQQDGNHQSITQYNIKMDVLTSNPTRKQAVLLHNLHGFSQTLPPIAARTGTCRFLLHNYLIHHGACPPILFQLRLCSSESLHCYSSHYVLIASKPMAVQIYHWITTTEFIMKPNSFPFLILTTFRSKTINDSQTARFVYQCSIVHFPASVRLVALHPGKKRDGISWSRLRQPQILDVMSTTNSSSIITHHSTMYTYALKYKNI